MECDEERVGVEVEVRPVRRVSFAVGGIRFDGDESGKLIDAVTEFSRRLIDYRQDVLRVTKENEELRGKLRKVYVVLEDAMKAEADSTKKGWMRCDKHAVYFVGGCTLCKTEDGLSQRSVVGGINEGEFD
jgi:hypothetical protein